MGYPLLTVRLATVMHQLGLATRDDDTLQAAVHRAVADHWGDRSTPAWIGVLFDAVLAGRVTDGAVPCPSGYVDGAEGLAAVLLDVTTHDGRTLRMHGDRGTWTWTMGRLNLVLRLGPESYTLTPWVTAYPRLTTGLATILHGLGLAGADDDALRADVHEFVSDTVGDREPPAWMTTIVENILNGRFDDRPVRIPSGRPDGGTVLDNLVAHLRERFPLRTYVEGEWWEWSLPAYDAFVLVTFEVAGGNEYTVGRLSGRSG